MGGIKPSQYLSNGSGLLLPFGFQVRCMDLSSFKAYLLQVIVGLHRCTSSESFLNTCPIHVYFLWVRSTMMSSCFQMFRTSKLDIFCGYLTSKMASYQNSNILSSFLIHFYIWFYFPCAKFLVETNPSKFANFDRKPRNHILKCNPLRAIYPRLIAS